MGTLITIVLTFAGVACLCAVELALLFYQRAQHKRF